MTTIELTAIIRTRDVRIRELEARCMELMKIAAATAEEMAHAGVQS